MVNHISELDLDSTNPAQLDGEHFLIKVNVPVEGQQTQQQRFEEQESIGSSFNVVPSPDKNQTRPSVKKKKKKFAKRIVKKDAALNEAQIKLRENQEKHDAKIMAEALTSFKKGLMDIFDVW